MNRKGIWLMLAFVLLVCLTQCISVGTNVDVNRDGKVDRADLEFVDKHIGMTGDHAADVNDDKVVNRADLMLVENAIEIATPPPSADVDGMVLIPAGEFEMGSNNLSRISRAGRRRIDRASRPVHTVYVDASYIDKYEVTNAEYAAFLNARGKHAEGGIAWCVFDTLDVRIEHVDGTYHVDARYENHPMVRVSWYGAMAYAKWAGKRLPTEAEWEKAARGGLVGKRYPWGDTVDATNANYGRTVGYTTAMGSYPANGYGLYDMSGNVTEWCLDAFDSYFYRNSPPRNPISGGSIQFILDNYTYINIPRTIRGGSFLYDASSMRVANRSSDTPTASYNVHGFRCVRAVTP